MVVNTLSKLEERHKSQILDSYEADRKTILKAHPMRFEPVPRSIKDKIFSHFESYWQKKF